MINLRTLALALTACLLVGCVSSNTVPRDQRASLLTGERLFGEVVPPVEPEPIFEVSEEMKLWVRDQVGDHPHGKTRLRKLLDAMLSEGLLNLDYSLNRSLTAQQTFNQRTGNCLSFSILFVALARELDLPSKFQIVAIPPSFSQEDELVLLNNHINVRVKGIRSGVQHVQDHVVDFNSAEYNGNYKTHQVDDAYATSLYHGNRAVELIGVGNHREAFRHLKRGLRDSPNIAGLWVNLGVLYARQGLFSEAERAYQIALNVEPANKSALVNLAKAARQQGNDQDAEYYAQRVARYLKSNPYFYSQRARDALHEEDFSEALALLDMAIELKADEHQFHHLQALALYQQGRRDEAKQSIRNARRVAHRTDLKNIYQRKLNGLGGD